MIEVTTESFDAELGLHLVESLLLVLAIATRSSSGRSSRSVGRPAGAHHHHHDRHRHRHHSAPVLSTERRIAPMLHQQERKE